MCVYNFKDAMQYRGATSSSLHGSNFHELLFDHVVFLFIEQWYNFFANGHRKSPLCNILKMRTFVTQKWSLPLWF